MYFSQYFVSYNNVFVEKFIKRTTYKKLPKVCPNNLMFEISLNTKISNTFINLKHQIIFKNSLQVAFSTHDITWKTSIIF